MLASSLRISPKIHIEEGFFRIFCLYICTGNLWRLFPTPILKENILLSEFLLFVFCFLQLIFKQVYSLRHLKFLGISGVILLSSGYGAVLNGFEIAATLYALRLICLILCGVLIGEIFFKKFGHSILEFYKWMSFYYTVQLGFGFLIYICFRDSQVFWLFLSYLGISYSGDPHIGRFLSIYFDPNFYAAIAGIPFIAMYRLAHWIPSKQNILRIGFLLFSIILTWSRSGIATFFMLLVYLGFEFLCRFKMLILRNKVVFGILVGFLICSIGFFVRFEDMCVFLTRLITVKTEGSAMSRWNSFRLGLDVFLEHPVLGVGYNYLSRYVRGILSGSSIDSSVLATFANFGVILSGLFVVLFVVYSCRFKIACGAVRSKNKEVAMAGNLYLVYLWSVVIFASLFNNLLYFQFWLVPMVAIFTYLSLYIESIRTATTPTISTVRSSTQAE